MAKSIRANGDRIDAAELEHVLELRFGKVAADIGNMLGCVEIEMHLAESHIVNLLWIVRYLPLKEK